MYKELDRTKSSFNISIGTGLALETLFEPISPRYDNDRKIPYDNRVDIDTYQYHFINIFTIIRNILQSTPESVKLSEYNINTLMSTVKLELNTIQEIYSNYKCELVVYLTDYSKLIKYVLKHRTISNSTYTKNFDILKLHEVVIDHLDDLQGIVNIALLQYNALHKMGLRKTLITTHIPYDICNRSFELLESFTGIIKTYSDFNSKYLKIGKDYNMGILPFDPTLLLVFGDKSIIAPMDRNKRIDVYNYALKNWNMGTTNSTITRAIISKFKLHII